MTSVHIPWRKGTGLQEEPEPHSSADPIAGVGGQSLALRGEAWPVAPTHGPKSIILGQEQIKQRCFLEAVSITPVTLECCGWDPKLHPCWKLAGPAERRVTHRGRGRQDILDGTKVPCVACLDVSGRQLGALLGVWSACRGNLRQRGPSTLWLGQCGSSQNLVGSPATKPSAVPEKDFGPLCSLSTGLREGVARGRATVDWNHIVRPAQGNTNTHQVPSQEGDGATVAMYILEHTNTRREGVPRGDWVRSVSAKLRKQDLGTAGFPKAERCPPQNSG